MVRAVALFMLVFSALCLLVHLQTVGGVFGIVAFWIFVIDQVVGQFFPHPDRVRGQPLL